MKTSLNSMLGAALCLLATATTTPAGGKGNGGGGGGAGGGGGGGSTPQGTIYYYGNIEGWSGTPTCSMNADGSNRTAIPSGDWCHIYGSPSIHPHNTHRWFEDFSYLQDPDHIPTPEEPVKYLEYPDGATRTQRFAVRGDYHPDTNNTPETISLLLDDDPTLQILSRLKWLFDDNSISFIARRWSSSDPAATVVEGGIYVLPVVFDADGNIAGLGELPTTPTVPLPLTPEDGPNQDGVDHPTPDMTSYSWNPEGEMYVHGKKSGAGLWVTDLLSGAETRITTAGYEPAWSPDGKWIAYGNGSSILKIMPDGKRQTMLLERTSTWEFYGVCWAPDSLYLACTGQDFDDHINWDIFIMNVNGGDLVNLTNTPGMGAREGLFPGKGGWR